jgi:hypothetical protein
VNVRISFNCFSSVEWCKVCTQNTRSALTESVSILKLRRDSTKLSLCKECKVTAARCAQSSAGTQTLRKNLVQSVHREKGERQEGERNFSSRNPLDLSYRNP